MNNHFSRELRRKLRRRSGDTAKLAAQLAPLEEQTKRARKSEDDGNHSGHPIAHQEAGAIVVDGHRASLAKELGEVHEKELRRGLEPVVLVILLLALVFIAYIAWEVSKMPAPPTP
ncbi:MAG TPA: hypothetical protein VLA93_06675 [Pyrinomonadaceae bacterium]|nr:hypothetical protein [Pyrinomonadaceae bacterium]